MAVGIGYDAHRWAAGRPLILGGVEIPAECGLLGHSDADVLIHAIIDALLGAAVLGDIGQHFPDTDAAYRGVASTVLLARVQQLLTEHGLTIHNIDATVIMERPRLSPYLPAMRRRIAEILNIAEKQVSLKATTNEGMGFVGRQEGVAALAVAQLDDASPGTRREAVR
ncbi:MAG: 2-C-methyl-D-erythritol 2,4-cyclodiphosphate synthase [Bacillota bacterium]